jgi:hypothetical protein
MEGIEECGRRVWKVYMNSSNLILYCYNILKNLKYINDKHLLIILYKQILYFSLYFLPPKPSPSQAIDLSTVQ